MLFLMLIAYLSDSLRKLHKRINYYSLKSLIRIKRRLLAYKNVMIDVGVASENRIKKFSTVWINCVTKIKCCDVSLI